MATAKKKKDENDKRNLLDDVLKPEPVPSKLLDIAAKTPASGSRETLMKNAGNNNLAEATKMDPNLAPANQETALQIEQNNMVDEFGEILSAVTTINEIINGAPASAVEHVTPEENSDVDAMKEQQEQQDNTEKLKLAPSRKIIRYQEALLQKGANDIDMLSIMQPRPSLGHTNKEEEEERNNHLNTPTA